MIEYSEASTYGRTFFVGLLNTVLVSVLGIIAATVLGFILGIARLCTPVRQLADRQAVGAVYRDLP
ncbi:Glutamate Aspartate transport system permease protein GltJ [Marinobacterium lacunae]|uniref:Glutamate Aspartate transport system permease protein GltJ n=1 Tax=Marinobacterium lacunae TaxID=1232683 RepID=A0A081G4U0_9GAMM|nr:Glutamate Aspartate transport system permease protein GltJ [Marinobacterium lacunae]